MTRGVCAVALAALIGLTGCCRCEKERFDVFVSPDGEIRTPQAALAKFRELRQSGALDRTESPGSDLPPASTSSARSSGSAPRTPASS